eukprot:15183147-Ditylum_brightwellii.AAC.1
MVKEINHFLDYMATYPNTAIRFHTSVMVLHIHIDAVYMVLPEARLHTGGYFYLSAKPNKKTSNKIPSMGWSTTNAALFETSWDQQQRQK